MTNKNTEPVHLIEHFRVSPEILFDAWLTPDLVRLWLFKSPTNEITPPPAYPQKGDDFSILEWNGHEFIDHFGTYLEILRPSRLVFTLFVPKHFKGITQVTVDIQSNDTGSLLTFIQTGVDRATTEGNWRDMLQRLKQVING
jgi:uncharacterized protein YndB with AHSA1/START domain